MSCGTCSHHTHASHNRHGIRMLLVAVYCATVGFSLYLHIGLNWSPWVMVPALAVVVHAVVFGIIALVTARLVRAEGVSTDKAHSHAPQMALIQRPRLYDGFIRIATLGGENRFRRRILAMARLKVGDALLDVGCGTGSQLLLAAPIVGPEGTLCGIEPSAPMVEHALTKAKARGVDLRVRQDSADHLPFADGSFDAVLCTMVLHHLPPTERAVAMTEMYRVLRAGGRIVVADVQRRRAVSMFFSVVSLSHLRAPHQLLDAAEIHELLARVGFDGIERQAWGGAIGVLAAVRT
ncbi:MAG: class I SAM-dependent methyltransferase [Phycisphaerales bacterium]